MERIRAPYKAPLGQTTLNKDLRQGFWDHNIIRSGKPS